MDFSRNEHTVANSCQIHGRGYWSGQKVCVEIHPASQGTGIQLVRSDLPRGPQCPALVVMFGKMRRFAQTWCVVKQSSKWSSI